MNFFYDMDDASNLILWYDLYIRYGMITSVQPEDCSRKGDGRYDCVINTFNQADNNLRL